jgi:hypothetical protein
MLIGAALILTACSRISEAITLTINLDLQLLRKLLEMGKVGTFISRILIIGKPFGQILAWIIILIAFYIMTRKQPENES